MKNLKKLLFAAALVAVAVTSAPSTAEATVWCTQCAATGDCFPCCKCDGGTTAYCSSVCG